MRPLGVADEREVAEQVVEQQGARRGDCRGRRPVGDRRQREALARLVQQPGGRVIARLGDQRAVACRTPAR